MQKITPFLWFDGKAEEAANFYTAIFNDARITDVMRSGDGGPGAKGSILSATFDLAGQKFIALNGGSMFQFTPAISFFVGPLEASIQGSSLMVVLAYDARA